MIFFLNYGAIFFLRRTRFFLFYGVREAFNRLFLGESLFCRIFAEFYLAMVRFYSLNSWSRRPFLKKRVPSFLALWAYVKFWEYPKQLLGPLCRLSYFSSCPRRNHSIFIRLCWKSSQSKVYNKANYIVQSEE